MLYRADAWAVLKGQAAISLVAWRVFQLRRRSGKDAAPFWYTSRLDYTKREAREVDGPEMH